MEELKKRIGLDYNRLSRMSIVEDGALKVFQSNLSMLNLVTFYWLYLSFAWGRNCFCYECCELCNFFGRLVESKVATLSSSSASYPYLTSWTWYPPPLESLVSSTPFPFSTLFAMINWIYQLTHCKYTCTIFIHLDTIIVQYLHTECTHQLNLFHLTWNGSF